MVVKDWRSPLSRARGLDPAQAQRSSRLIPAVAMALTAATLWLSYGGA